jgi:hypothetical protein
MKTDNDFEMARWFIDQAENMEAEGIDVNINFKASGDAALLMDTPQGSHWAPTGKVTTVITIETMNWVSMEDEIKKLKV